MTSHSNKNIEINRCGSVIQSSELNLSNRGTTGKFLTNKGECQLLYCTFATNTISFWKADVSVPISIYRFDENCTIADVCNLPFKDGTDGVVIGVNSEGGKSYIAYFCLNMSRIVRKIFIASEVTCVYTVLDNTRTADIMRLHEKLHESPHLIAVGTANGYCYLTHFNVALPDEPGAVEMEPSLYSDLCCFEKTNGMLNVKSSEPYSIPASSAKVTALYYVAKCKVMFIGFSCGIFIIFGIGPTPVSRSFLYSRAPIFGFALQEPADDPRPMLFLWIVYSKNFRSSVRQDSSLPKLYPHAILSVLMFPDENELPIDERTFSRPSLSPHLEWKPNEDWKWISLQVVHRNEFLKERHEDLNESSGTTRSFTGSSESDSSLLFMTWIRDRTIEGCIFDLNAYYNKRLVRRIIFDGTVAHQNAFISRFTLWKETDYQYGSPYDFILYPWSVSRFDSPFGEYNDALFFSSSFLFNVMTFTSTHWCGIHVPSYQQQVLNFIESNFGTIVKNYAPIMNWLHSVGLTISNSHISDEQSFVRTLLYHRSISALRDWISSTSNRVYRQNISNILWNELSEMKEKLDENVKWFFVQNLNTVSKSTYLCIRTAVEVFGNISVLYSELLRNAQPGEDAETASWEYNQVATTNLEMYAELVLRFSSWGLLPESVGYNKIVRERMMSLNSERSTEAKSRRENLWLDELLEAMRRVSREGSFWLNDWYPPKTILTFLEIVLETRFNQLCKLKIIGYFLLDYQVAANTDSEMFNFFKWYFIRDEKLAQLIETQWMRDRDLKTRKNGLPDACKIVVDEFDLTPDNNKLLTYYDTCMREKNGVALWNQFCLSHKLFTLLEKPISSEPFAENWVKRCNWWSAKIINGLPRGRETIHDIRRRYKLSALPQNVWSESVDRMTSISDAGNAPPNYVFGKSHHTPEKTSTKDVSKSCDISPVHDYHSTYLEKKLTRKEYENVRRIFTAPKLQKAQNSDDSPDRSLNSCLSVGMYPGILKSTKKQYLGNTSEIRPRLRFAMDIPQSSTKLTNCENDSLLSRDSMKDFLTEDKKRAAAGKTYSLDLVTQNDKDKTKKSEIVEEPVEIIESDTTVNMETVTDNTVQEQINDSSDDETGMCESQLMVSYEEQSELDFAFNDEEICKTNIDDNNIDVISKPDEEISIGSVKNYKALDESSCDTEIPAENFTQEESSTAIIKTQNKSRKNDSKGVLPISRKRASSTSSVKRVSERLRNKSSNFTSQTLRNVRDSPTPEVCEVSKKKRSASVPLPVISEIVVKENPESAKKRRLSSCKSEGKERIQNKSKLKKTQATRKRQDSVTKPTQRCEISRKSRAGSEPVSSLSKVDRREMKTSNEATPSKMKKKTVEIKSKKKSAQANRSFGDSSLTDLDVSIKTRTGLVSLMPSLSEESQIEAMQTSSKRRSRRIIEKEFKNSLTVTRKRKYSDTLGLSHEDEGEIIRAGRRIPYRFSNFGANDTTDKAD